jgi:transcriptional antiterminator NusG
MSEEIINSAQETEEISQDVADTSSHRWYVINAVVGQEKKVAKTLKYEIGHRSMESLISEVIVPAERVTEIKRGKKVCVEKKACPGYIIVRMEMNDKTWQLIKSISGVARFLEKDKRPVQVPEREIHAMLEHLENISVNNQDARNIATYVPGDIVQVVDGAFEGFSALVESVDYEKSRVKVSVSIFGRETPIEIDFKQASKANH